MRRTLFSLLILSILIGQLFLVTGLQAFSGSGNSASSGEMDALLLPPTARPSLTPSLTPVTNTPTPYPTQPPGPNPTHTPISATATPLPPTAVIAQKVINVRSGPGVIYNIMGVAHQDERYLVTGQYPPGDWLQINYNGKVGWVYRALVALEGAIDEIPPVTDIPPTPTFTPSPTPTDTPTPTLTPTMAPTEEGATQTPPTQTPPPPRLRLPQPRPVRPRPLSSVKTSPFAGDRDLSMMKSVWPTRAKPIPSPAFPSPETGSKSITRASRDGFFSSRSNRRPISNKSRSSKTFLPHPPSRQLRLRPHQRRKPRRRWRPSRPRPFPRQNQAARPPACLSLAVCWRWP